MNRSNSASRVSHALTLLAIAGLASPLVAGGESPGQRAGTLVPTHKAGVLYLNLDTGERTLTRYDAEMVPEIEMAHSTTALFDYWMSMDENPCWDDPREEGFGIGADMTTDVTEGIFTPVVAWEYGDMPFDSKITGVSISTAMLHFETVDSNNDGVLDTGVDTVLAYYDALSEGNRSSIAPPTAVVRVESLPGNNANLPSGVFADYDIVVDFGGAHFELGDSDGTGLGSMWLPGAAAGMDVDTTDDLGDGLADFQYLQYYVKHGGDDKVTSNSTFFALGMPDGEFIQTTHVTTVTPPSETCTAPPGGCEFTITETIFVADPLPAGQGVRDSIGFGSLVSSGNLGEIQTLPGFSKGCCFSFGGVDCAGFLEQLVLEPEQNPTYFNFSPFAQIAQGFFTDTAPDPCLRVDFNNDSFIDSGDITIFIQLFLAQDRSADLNGDGFICTGDIGAFISLFLACPG